MQEVADNNVQYAVTRAVYNVYLHPLSRFPGPPLWTAFTFTSLANMLGGRLPYQVKKLRDQYGRVVRIAPNEISIIGSRAWKDIFLRRDFLRPPQWGARPPLVTADNLISASAKDHARFRKALAPAFSEKAMREYEPVVRGYFDKLLARFDALIRDSRIMTTLIGLGTWSRGCQRTLLSVAPIWLDLRLQYTLISFRLL